MKRYLVTTAEELTWRRDRPLLFLGDWCLRHDRRAAWEELDYVVAAPVYFSGADRKQAVAQVQTLTGQLLPELAAALNQYHGVLHGQRYWQILLGHWLQRWVSTACNRYQTLKRALDSYDVEGTTLLHPHNFSLATKDSLAYIWATNDDLWNHILWVEVLNYIGAEGLDKTILNIDTEVIFFDFLPEKKSPPTLRSFLRKTANLLMPKLARDSDAFIVGSYLPRFMETVLFLKMMQMPQSWQTPKIIFPTPTDRTLLISFFSSAGKRGAEGFVRELLPKVLPSCFVEGYKNLASEATKMSWPSHPKFIFTSNNFDTDEVFKHWTALKTEKGVPYFTGQHGNNYGTHFYFGNRNWPERSAVDFFLTWGWSDSGSNTISAFNFKTAYKNLKSNKNGGLLLVEKSIEHRWVIWDVTSDHIEYFNQQLLFVESLADKLREQLTVRLPREVNRYLFSEHNRWSECYPTLLIDDGQSSFRSVLARNRLVVFSYDSTGILEMLNTNNPFICFWPKKWEHLEKTAIPYYEILKEAGIYQDSPEAAAEMVARVWDNISDWWDTKKVQDARISFCEKYSRASQNPLKYVLRALRQAEKNVINNKKISL